MQETKQIRLNFQVTAQEKTVGKSGPSTYEAQLFKQRTKPVFKITE